MSDKILSLIFTFLEEIIKILRQIIVLIQKIKIFQQVEKDGNVKHFFTCERSKSIFKYVNISKILK